MKRMTAIGLCVILLFAAALPMLAACDPQEVPEWDAKAELTAAGVELTFDAVEGAEEYRIYHSPSRYGEYELVSTQKEPTYTHEDAYGYFRAEAVREGQVVHTERLSWETETFGENMRVFAPTDDAAAVEADIAAAYEASGQFSEARYAAFFKAGDYGDLALEIRYYMTVGGLGTQPGDVRVASLDVPAQLSNGNGTCNFWFAAENMRVTGDVNWVASQATSFRRMQVDGDMQLTAGSSNSWGSGGFIADSAVAGTIDANVQQQWLTRNSAWGAWEGGDINLTFVGSAAGSPVPAKGINGLDTVTVDETPVLREKPFLIFDDGYYVAVPDMRKNAAGVSWQGANDGYTYIPLFDFYVARSDRDTAATLNAALDAGKHLFFTPGIYDIAEPLQVKKAGTVVLGCGLATLRCADENGTAIMYVSDIGGVKLGGLLFDAGAHSENLLRIGDEKTGVSHAADPIFCSDVYFRIGGARQCATYVRQTLVINANDVVGDNFWVWRGDHSYGVGWEYSEYTDEDGNLVTNGNVTENGVVVNGDNVTVYGLMVEHFHKYQTVWNGENGFVAFYQSETPYEVPEQSAWMSEWQGVSYNGYASYKIADGVQKHTAYGIGVYFVSRGGVYVLDHAVEAPASGGISLHHIALALFSGPDGSGIAHFVNGHGDGIFKPYQVQKKQMASFIAGEVTM